MGYFMKNNVNAIRMNVVHAVSAETVIGQLPEVYRSHALDAGVRAASSVLAEYGAVIGAIDPDVRAEKARERAEKRNTETADQRVRLGLTEAQAVELIATIDPVKASDRARQSAEKRRETLSAEASASARNAGAVAALGAACGRMLADGIFAAGESRDAAREAVKAGRKPRKTA